MSHRDFDPEPVLPLPRDSANLGDRSPWPERGGAGAAHDLAGSDGPGSGNRRWADRRARLGAMRLRRVHAAALAAFAVAACQQRAAPKPKGMGRALVQTAARSLSLTPDASTILFLADINPPPEKDAPEGVLQGILTAVGTQGGEPRPLGGGVTTLEDGYRISPDGRFVAYLAGFRFKDQSGALYLAPIPSGEAQLIAQGATFYKFSPDGARLGYVAGGEMHLRSLADGADRKVASPAATFEFSRGARRMLFLSAAGKAPARVGAEGVSSFVFSPDSRWLSFLDGMGPKKTFGDLELVPAAGGPVVKLGQDVVEHRWAPDSKWVALRESHENKAGRVWSTFKVAAVPSGKVRFKVDGAAKSFLNFAFSSDAGSLAYLRVTKDDLALWLLSLAKKEPPREVEKWVYSYQFAPGDRELWYRSHCTAEGRRCDLMSQSVKDPAQKPAKLAEGVLGFKVAAGGERVLLTFPRFDTRQAADLGYLDLKTRKVVRGVDQYALPGALFADPAGRRIAYLVGERKREGVYVVDLK
jgi:dipeptidyl aminopeptidase/acylaminoacyl peptidase